MKFAEHIRARACTRKTSENWSSVQKISLELQAKLKQPPNRNLGRKDQWHAIYRTIFPNASKPGYPYLNTALVEVIGIFTLFWSQSGPKFAAAFLETRQDSLLDAGILYFLVMDLLRHIQDNIQRHNPSEEEDIEPSSISSSYPDPIVIKRDQGKENSWPEVDDFDGKFDSPSSNLSSCSSWTTTSSIDFSPPTVAFQYPFTIAADCMTEEPSVLPYAWLSEGWAADDNCFEPQAKSHELPNRNWEQVSDPRALTPRKEREYWHYTKLSGVLTKTSEKHEHQEPHPAVSRRHHTDSAKLSGMNCKCWISVGSSTVETFCCQGWKHADCELV
jgi:hypothetical protein